jgi:hypothetical protein
MGEDDIIPLLATQSTEWHLRPVWWKRLLLRIPNKRLRAWCVKDDPKMFYLRDAPAEIKQEPNGDYRVRFTIKTDVSSWRGVEGKAFELDDT